MAKSRRSKPTVDSAFAGPSESPGFLLWQVTNAWQRDLRGALKPLGLTHVQFVLLARATWAALREVPLTQVELGKAARTDPMMTSQVVRTLEQRGLVDRTRDAADARAIRVTPTKAGSILTQRAITIVEAADAEFFAVLGAKLPEFTRGLAQLTRIPA
jgi:DNA-binding MarR family transcriptional regulator